MTRAHISLLAIVSMTACGAPPTVDCGEGHYHEDDVARYCGYGVIVGGFNCPPELPNAFDVDLPEGGVAMVCSDADQGGPLPSELCVDLGAPDGCEATPRPGSGDERMPLPEVTPSCAPAFGPVPPGSIGGIRVGRHGTPFGTPLDELSDGDTVTVFEDAAGEPALALALQIGREDQPSFICYLVNIRTTFVDRGTTSDAPPYQPLAERGGRLAVVPNPLGPIEGSLDGETVELELTVQDFMVEETRTITLRLDDPE